MTDGTYLYIVKCRDGSFYVGTTRSSLEIRIAQHNAGTFRGIPSPGGLLHWSIPSGLTVFRMPLKPNGSSRDGVGQRKRLLSMAISCRCTNSPSARRPLNSGLPIPRRDAPHPESLTEKAVSDFSGL